ncbi:putative CocE/NonD family hydrolase [Kitasatospora sp. MAP12-15]|uniref:CocE/NonD family hydrolase n=1 Tax=unclassified Kitasatospora TaxID=2633591 RepID=UPI0024730FA5|nr:CocE/NonD family hydrolase [Kitasatospora sp. MAP12-44]MDH6109838.1 putative CocE/NonD family hydrolase [Kitasatospora sp. MAP12-44]
MQHPTSYPYRTTREDVRIPLASGVELAARIWHPVTDAPVPALLEYLPDRLTDRTAPRDAQRHPWYAGHGYASVRVDARGHGNSPGLPNEAMSGDGALADGVAVLNWLAAQPWCTGRVGMFGLGPGGSLALRIAALAPEPLKALVTAGAGDDRYEADGPYLGGAPLAPALAARSAALLAAAAHPPDPKYVGDAWRAGWLERLAAVEPPLADWLAHPTRDATWQHGSLREDYGTIRAAVLAVAGWTDPARDTVLRLVEHLAAPVRGVLGPWPRQYPDADRTPGPAIGFLQESLRWWDHWLKDVDTGVLREPALRCWMNSSVPPATAYANRPGRWIGEDRWPSDDVRQIHYGLADALRTAAAPAAPATPAAPAGEHYVEVRSPQHTGIDAGRLCPIGGAGDLPPDQREEDGRSVCFDTAPLPERIEVLGRAAVRLRLRCDAPHGRLVARLCDVAPDGSSTLVTRGVLNLGARRGLDRVTPWEPGGVEAVECELAATAHAFAPGHRLRLALSSCYWPWIWPPPEATGFAVDPGHSTLALPVRHLAAASGRPAITFEEPEQAAGPAWHTAERDPARPERLVVRDVAAGEWRLEVDPDPEGPLTHPDGLVRSGQALETYRIQQDDPLTAVARADRTVRLQRPDQGWDITVRSSAELSCDAAHFTATSRLVAWEGGAVVFERDWRHRLPRTTG